MNEALEDFLLPRLPIVGLVAYSIQLPDRVLATQCFSKSLYPSATEQMLTRLVHSGRTLLPAGQSAARYCWIFECLRVYVAARADGACLALLVENNAGVQMLRIQETLQAFGELPVL
jgi:hypothetical protein